MRSKSLLSRLYSFTLHLRGESEWLTLVCWRKYAGREMKEYRIALARE